MANPKIRNIVPVAAKDNPNSFNVAGEEKYSVTFLKPLEVFIAPQFIAR